MEDFANVVLMNNMKFMLRIWRLAISAEIRRWRRRRIRRQQPRRNVQLELPL
jgi:hypothetical protein